MGNVAALSFGCWPIGVLWIPLDLEVWAHSCSDFSKPPFCRFAVYALAAVGGGDWHALGKIDTQFDLELVDGRLRSTCGRLCF